MNNKKKKFFYIDFEIIEEIRFEKLLNLFNTIKELKGETNGNDFNSYENIDWLSFLDEKAINNQEEVFDFNSPQGKIYEKLWEMTTPNIRINHPFFIIPGPWDYESILESIFNGEYKLVEIGKDDNKIGTLYFDPWAGPFGGTESLVALIELFGHKVTYDLWHNGPHLKEKSEWDYQIAKELVKKNIGVK